MDPDPRPVLRLSWASELPRGCVRVARHVLAPEVRADTPLHTHEFAELMWIDAGRCEHVINGAEEILEPDDYRCIRPGDVHLARCDGRPCTAVNISFRLEPLAGLAERYGADWPWAGGARPRSGRLSPLVRERLSAWLDILSAPDPRQVDLEAFLIDLTRMLSTAVAAPRAAGLPAWLASAVEVFSQPRHLRGGVPELARLCGRSREHLNRIVRASQGRRATDLVNALRMDWIAAQLHATDAPLEALAAECGLPSQRHFYRLFRTTFGVTPAAWRRAVRTAYPANQALNTAPWMRQ